MAVRTFKVFKKDGTKVAQGASPLSITGIASNTVVKDGDYYAVAVENDRDSVKTDIPEFVVLAPKAQFSLTVSGKETTGQYNTADLNQVEFLALGEKQDNVLYRVQPTDAGSGRVHFLGSTPVDLTKDGSGTVVYSRNILKGTSESKSLVGKNSRPTIDPLYESAVIAKIGDKFSFISKAKSNTDSAGQVGVSFRKSYERIATINTSDVDSNLSIEVTTNKEQVVGFGGIYAQADPSFIFTGNIDFSRTKLIKESLANMIEYSLAPEDIIPQSTNTGGSFA